MTKSQIRAFLKRRNWEPKDLARELKCSVRSVQYWLRGDRKMRPMTAQAIRRLA